MIGHNEATQRQITAAMPDRSTWLSANAGSGKTKVLTDRGRSAPKPRVICQ